MNQKKIDKALDSLRRMESCLKNGYPVPAYLPEMEDPTAKALSEVQRVISGLAEESANAVGYWRRLEKQKTAEAARADALARDLDALNKMHTDAVVEREELRRKLSAARDEAGRLGAELVDAKNEAATLSANLDTCRAYRAEAEKDRDAYKAALNREDVDHAGPAGGFEEDAPEDFTKQTKAGRARLAVIEAVLNNGGTYADGVKAARAAFGGMEAAPLPRVSLENMTSRNGRGKAPNQFLIRTPDGVYFQSYQSIIAFKPLDKSRPVVLDVNKWDFSATTNRFRCKFLGENMDETRKKIKAGLYILADLNA